MKSPTWSALTGTSPRDANPSGIGPTAIGRIVRSSFRHQELEDVLAQKDVEEVSSANELRWDLVHPGGEVRPFRVLSNERRELARFADTDVLADQTPNRGPVAGRADVEPGFSKKRAYPRQVGANDGRSFSNHGSRDSAGSRCAGVFSRSRPTRSSGGG
jgi:hypothetical protein